MVGVAKFVPASGGKAFKDRGRMTMRIALDAMGGDLAPGPIVAGAVEAVRMLDDLVVVLVGDEERVNSALIRSRMRPGTGCRYCTPAR